MYCRTFGMELVSFDSHQENIAVIDALNNKVKHMKYFWTAGTDINREGNYYWITTGEEIFDHKQLSWHKNKPDGGSTENCLTIGVILFGSKDLRFDDRACLENFYVFCQKTENSTLC